MPIINIQIIQGHSATQKTDLLKNMTQAVVDSIGAPLASVRVVIQEVMRENVIVAGELGKDMALATVGLIAGRTEEQKAALIAALAHSVETSIGLSIQNVRVILLDTPTTDMGVAGGKTAKAAGR
jgi:4-oxalocrotonate tautomerase family enzyme